MTKKLLLYIEELRAPFFTATIIPVVLGTLIAWAKDNIFHPGYFLLTLFGVVFLHAGTNVINDYFDHKSGNDKANTEFVRPFTGGSRLIQKGLLTPRSVLITALIFFLLGSLIGIYLTYQRGITVLILGLIGVFSGYFYSAPPFRLANRGIGEVVVGINFGVLVVLGAYFIQTQRLDWEPVTASLPVALLVAAILYINEFPDYRADKVVGKNNLVVRLGKEKAVVGFIMLLWATYLSIVLAVVFNVITPFALLGLLTFPLALKTMKVARNNYNNISNLVPANAGTIINHLATGILMCLAYVLQKLFLS